MSLKFQVFIAHLLFVCSAVFAQNTSISVDKKSDPNPIVAGSNITYTITVSTEGPDAAANATLTDILPAGTTFVSLASPAGWTCTTGGTVTCSTASFPPGSEVFTLVLQTDPSLVHGSTLSNTATISTTTADPDDDDNVSTSNTIVEARSDLGVTKSIAPDPAPIGGPATFTIGYSATGPSHAPNVTISDVLPPGIFFDSVSAPGWSCATPAVGANGAVTCTTASLSAGANGTITIGVTIDSAMAAGTTITNTATIAGDIIDDNSANDSAVASATAQHISNLAIDKSAAPSPVTAGSTLTYTIDVTASGPSSAPGVAMNDVLPAATTFTSLASPIGWSCATPAVGATGAVNCTHSSLSSGYAETFTLVVTVDPSVANGTTISNTSTISGNVVEATADNSSTADVTVSIVSDLSVTKSAPAMILAGGSMSYSIAYNASGPSASSGVTIADALPPETTFDSIVALGFTCTTPSVGASGSVSCTAATLAPSANGTIVINVAILPGTAPSIAITNTATVSSAAGDANPGNDSSTATTTVTAPPITGTKNVTPSIAAVGGNVTYTIVLHNGGAFAQGDNAGDEFVDVLPASLALVSASATSGTATAEVANNTVHWNGSIAPGVDVTITIIATVLPGSAGTTISNQGTIRFDGDNNGTNELTTVTEGPGGGATVFAVAAPAIPTLSPLLMLAFAALLALVGLAMVRC